MPIQHWKIVGKSSFNRLVLLQTENEKLRSEVKILRSAVGQVAKNRQNLLHTVAPERVSKASQFLAILEGDEANEAFDLFESGTKLLSALNAVLGDSRAQRLCNLFGWSETAYVQDERLIATELGRGLLKAVYELTAEQEQSTTA